MTNESPCIKKWNIIRGLLFVVLLLTSFISLNHLYPFISFFSELSTRFLGGLGWCSAILALVYFGRGYLRELLILVAAFFIFGVIVGPFLSPAADPMEHLRRVHEENCGKTAEQVPRENRGLWQYSMVGVLLCTNGEKVDPVQMLRKVDIANGMLWALMAAVLYIFAKRSDLPPQWAFLSVLICFLYLGTNRFSYFRYYSLAPSLISMFIYWLWAAIFFFKNNYSQFSYFKYVFHKITLLLSNIFHH